MGKYTRHNATFTKADAQKANSIFLGMIVAASVVIGSFVLTYSVTHHDLELMRKALGLVCMFWFYGFIIWMVVGIIKARKGE